jgi:Tfp pilus assembly protein PilO
MNISRRVRFILGGVALVVLAVLVWFFVLSPIRNDIKTTENAIEEQRAQLSVAKATLAQAETTRAEGKRNQARLLELAKMVPPAPELPSLLLQIQDLADQSGIDFISISPGEPSQPQGLDYMIMPLELQFSGTFFDVSDFAYRAEQMVAGPGRLLSIKSISLAGETGTGTVSPKLSVSLSMLAYVMGQPPAAAAPTGAKGTTSQ